MTNQTEKLEKQTEQLLLRSMGAFGYLKVPYAFTQKYKYDKRSVLDPDATLTETEDEARLTFVFKKGKDGKLVHSSDRIPQTSIEEASQGK